MKIIDKESGKRLVKTDPIRRNAIKEMETEGASPMDPPEAFDESKNLALDSDNIPEAIQMLLDEHREIQEKVNDFEKAIKEYQEGNFVITPTINLAFSAFFSHLDQELVHHNAKEEKALFPALHKKLKETGEHSSDEIPRTAVNLMEDDHNQFIQLGTLSFNLLGLGPRLNDNQSRLFVLETAVQTSRELIELIRLHIYREENKIFPLAQQLLSENAFANILQEMNETPK